MSPIVRGSLASPLLLAALCCGGTACRQAGTHCASGEAITFSEITKRAFGDFVGLVCPDGSQYRAVLTPTAAESFLFVSGRSFARPLLVTAHEHLAPGRTEDHLFAYDLSTDRLQPLPALLGQQAIATLSPTGSLIAYESAGNPNVPLRLVVTDIRDGQNFFIPAATGATDHLPTWSVDGKELMFIRLSYKAGTRIPVSSTLMRTSFPPGNEAVVFGPEESVTSAAYSPRGKRFAIWSRNGLEIVDKISLKRTVILKTDSLGSRKPGTAGLIWGQRSGTLAYTLYDDKSSAYELWTIREDGGDARRIFTATDGTLYLGSYVRQ